MDVTIYRDRYGVPHIEGETLEAGYFGLGWCAAQDRPRTLLLHQRLLQGRLCEVLGVVPLPDPELPILDGLAHTPFFRGYADRAWELKDTAAVDRWMQMWDYFGAGERGLSDLHDRSRTVVDAFCAGVNHWYERNGAPDWFEPYEPATEVGWWGYYEHTIAMAFFISNAFAVSPARSADGSAWVGGDPHYWFFDGHAEAHVRTPEFELAGVWDGHVNLAMWGGTNRHVGMGITAAGTEGAVVYEETVDPENRERYWDSRVSGWRPFDRRVVGDHVVRSTHHGPVVGEGSRQGRPVAYAVRSAFHEAPGVSLDQHLELWRRTSVEACIEHVSASQFLRAHRVFADREGNIGYVSNGPVAVRDPRYDWSKPVDGSTEATALQERLWRPGADEYGLPVIVNPDCGFIQTANDPPWVSTIPAATHSDYPTYVYPEGWRELGTRGATQRRALAGNVAVGRGDLEDELLFSCFVPHAYHGIRALRAAYDGTPALSPRAETLDAILAAWDGNAFLDSPGMTVAFWLNRALDGGIPAPRVAVTDDPFGEPEIADPEVTPEQGRAYAYALELVADTLERLYGTLEKPWGEVHVIDRPDGPLGIPGGCNELRALIGTWGGWWDVGDDFGPDGVTRCNFGSRTLRLTRLGADGVETFSVAITGQVPAAEHPGSPHHRDQSELYAARRLKKLPLEREEYVAEAEASDHGACNHQAVERLEIGAVAR